MQDKTILTDIDAERGVLGSVCIDSEMYPIAAGIIKNKNYFYSERYQKIWEAISTLYLLKEPIDYITLSDQLSKEISTGIIKIPEITEITDKIPSSANCEYYAKIVREKWYARQLLKQYKISIKNVNDFIDSRQIWSESNENTRKIFAEENEKKYDLNETVEELYKISGHNPWGIAWGYDPIDSAFGCLDAGTSIIIAARPSHGKTTLALQLMDGWLGQGKKILYEGLDLPCKRMDLRRISRISKIPLHEIKQGIKNNIEIEKEIHRAAGIIFNRQKNVIIKDTSFVTVEDIVLDIRMAHDKIGINFLILDHFHRVNWGRREEMVAMKYGLESIYDICKQLNIIPVILAQLSRNPEREDVREPKLSDLRQCGQLEESTNVVLFLHWKYKSSGKPEDMNQNKILCAKNSDGKTGRITVGFNPAIFQFENYQITEHENCERRPEIRDKRGDAVTRSRNSFLSVD